MKYEQIFHIVISLLTTICYCKHNIAQALILKCKRMYRVFGSGSFHGPHAQFQQECRTTNSGRSINLLRAAETRMAGFFYAMHRALRLSKSLLATVHSAKWEALKNKKAIILRAAVDIKDDAYWKKGVYHPVRFLASAQAIAHRRF